MLATRIRTRARRTAFKQSKALWPGRCISLSPVVALLALFAIPSSQEVCAFSATGNARQSAAVAPSRPTYPPSEQGFREQLDTALQAYWAGNLAVGRQHLELFRLSDPAAWFAQNFDQDQASSLAERYDRLFPQYASSLAKTLEDLTKSKGSELKISQRNEPLSTPTTIGSVVPRQDLSLFRFRFQIRFKGKDVASWMETFANQNGAFRFIGLGAEPFWEKETDPVFSKQGHFVTPVELVRMVPPQYPTAARAHLVEGTVVLRALVDKQGKVKSLEVVDGHPLLVDAAIEAVRQWQYKPATLGGNAVEADTIISLVFDLRRH